MRLDVAITRAAARGARARADAADARARAAALLDEAQRATDGGSADCLHDAIGAALAMADALDALALRIDELAEGCAADRMAPGTPVAPAWLALLESMLRGDAAGGRDDGTSRRAP